MPIQRSYIFRCSRRGCDHANLVLASPQREAETVARRYLWSKSAGLWFCPLHAPAHGVSFTSLEIAACRFETLPRANAEDA